MLKPSSSKESGLPMEVLSDDSLDGWGACMTDKAHSQGKETSSAVLSTRKSTKAKTKQSARQVSSNPSDDNEYHWDDGVSAGLTQPRIATVRELSLSEADEQYAEVVQHAQYVQDIAEEDADAGLACGRSAGEDSGLIKQVDVEDEEDAHDRRRCARSKLKNDDREDYEYGVAHRLEDNIDEDLDNGQPSEGEDGVDDVVRRGKDRSAEINDGEKHTHPPVATLAVNDDNDSATQEEDDPWFNQATQSTIVKPTLTGTVQEYTATADTTRKPSAWKVLSSQPPAAARRAMTTRLRAGSHIVHTNATAGPGPSSMAAASQRRHTKKSQVNQEAQEAEEDELDS